MFYRVFEHYDDNLCARDFDNECFICFEYKSDNGMIPINLQIQRLYLNHCKCKGQVHNHCLKTWFDKNKTCPICRIKAIEHNNATIVIHTYIPWSISIYSYTKEMSLNILRIISFVLFFSILIDFYFKVIMAKYKRYDDYNYYDIPSLSDDFLNESPKELNYSDPQVS